MYLISFCLVLFLALASCEQSPQIQIPLGKIEGTLDKSVNGRTFYSFQGIPYAKPPVGKHRFKEAVPPKPWEGVWKANTKFQCLQYSQMPLSEQEPIEGTEDCLYVNVFTPKLKGNLDVIVFIHGGCFSFGSGAKYQPHILMDRDVVFVTLNYRLGPLGFLSTEDDTVPGNNGLKDQILALKWVKENIQYFGGNPDSVTINGMSAGGASVNFHTLSPKSKGLFKQAISTSGCMLNRWILTENPLEKTKRLAGYVGCGSDSVESMVRCLRKRPGKQIVAAVAGFQPWLYNPFTPFGVVVDSWSSDPILPKHPLQLLREQAVNDVPYIISHTTEEGLYPGYDFYPEQRLKYIDENWDFVMPHILDYNFTVDQSDQKDVSAKIRKEYFGTAPVSRNNFKKLVDVLGDRLFTSDLETTARLQSAAMKSPVYYYEFGYRGAHSWTEFKSGTTKNIGVSHGDDTVYVIKAEVDTQSTEEDRTISKFMVDMFLTFAKNGKPKTQSIDWPPVAKNINMPIKYLKIGSVLSVEEAEELGNRKFWESLPFNENEKLLPGKDEL